MSNKPLNIGEEARVQMPMKDGSFFDNYRSNGHVWGYFGIIESSINTAQD